MRGSRPNQLDTFELPSGAQLKDLGYSIIELVQSSITERKMTGLPPTQYWPFEIDNPEQFDSSEDMKQIPFLVAGWDKAFDSSFTNGLTMLSAREKTAEVEDESSVTMDFYVLSFWKTENVIKDVHKVAIPDYRMEEPRPDWTSPEFKDELEKGKCSAAELEYLSQLLHSAHPEVDK